MTKLYALKYSQPRYTDVNEYGFEFKNCLAPLACVVDGSDTEYRLVLGVYSPFNHPAYADAHDALKVLEAFQAKADKIAAILSED